MLVLIDSGRWCSRLPTRWIVDFTLLIDSPETSPAHPSSIEASHVLGSPSSPTEIPPGQGHLPWTNEASARSAVVLPLPFGPIKRVNLPSGSSVSRRTFTVSNLIDLMNIVASKQSTYSCPLLCFIKPVYAGLLRHEAELLPADGGFVHQPALGQCEYEHAGLVVGVGGCSSGGGDG